MVSDEAALLELLFELKSRQYQFTCVTPATHRRVCARPLAGAPSLRDIFGWNRTFREGQLEPRFLRLLRQAGCIDEWSDELRSRVRVASLGDQLFYHSSYPTDAHDAVFFGPDSYRFARFVRDELSHRSLPATILDMGAGSGVGGIVCAGLAPAATITLADVNPRALQLARINASGANVRVHAIQTAEIPSGHELIIANPPYMADVSHRAYRDGGRLFGGELALEWVRQALEVLPPGGTMLLYTGGAILDGFSPLLERIQASCADSLASLSSAELDPDVFGEELETGSYSQVERIALYGIRITTTSVPA